MDSESNSSFAFPNVGPLWWIAAVLLFVAYALSHSFTSMATYDDESYVMMTIKTFLDGDRLYAETYTQYGPAYYMIQQPIHGWLAIPITHDIVRLKTIFCWLLISGLAGVTATKMTGQSLAGFAAFLLTFVHLENLGLEPAHPQEVVAFVSLVSLWCMRTENRMALLFAGFCAALAALAKLNVGAVTAAACLFAAGFSQTNSVRMSRLFCFSGCLVAIGLAAGVFWTIAQKGLASGELLILAWPAMILLATVLLCVMAMQVLNDSTSGSTANFSNNRYWLTSSLPTVALGGIVGTAVVVGWAIVHENSIHEILYGVLLQHSFMSESFYHPMYPVGGGVPVAIGVTGLLFARIRRKFNDADAETASIDRVLMLCSPWVLFLSVGLMAMDCWKPLVHGLDLRGAGLFLSTVGPFLMPTLLIQRKTQFRLALAMLGCLSPIMAFPVPGTQVSLGTLPILLGIIVVSFDGCECGFVKSPLPRQLCRLVTVVVVVVAVASTAFCSYRWTQFVPLDQPGCRWVRLEPGRADFERSIAASIRGIDSNWLAFDTQNHNRFFFWTDKRPLTSISPTFWPLMLNDDQKSSIAASVTTADSICVVKLPAAQVKISEHAPAIESALFRGWHKVDDVDNWQIGLSR